MKNLLLTYQSHPMINIGDYIQSLAARQFLLESPERVERDYLNEYEGEEAKLIMNGWFTYRPENWPLSPKIHPLFIAFHLNETCRQRFFSPETVAYLRRYAPIGCRDEDTMKALQEKGIEAYFSGCLTLTLGQTYKSESRGEEVYIVDPLSYLPDDNSLAQILLTIFYLLWYVRPLTAIFRKLKQENPIHFSFSKIGVGRLLLWARAYVYLRNFVDKSILREAHYITHIFGNEELPTDEARFQRATYLVRMYARAKMVITSRIHCALPCLGLDTPVAFVKSTDDSEKSLCRFKGLENFFNIVEVRKDKVFHSFIPHIGKDTSFRNKETYKPYCKSLIRRCKSFMQVDNE